MFNSLGSIPFSLTLSPFLVRTSKTFIPQALTLSPSCVLLSHHPCGFLAALRVPKAASS